jgi:hypothetical protein
MKKVLYSAASIGICLLLCYLLFGATDWREVLAIGLPFECHLGNCLPRLFVVQLLYTRSKMALYRSPLEKGAV